ncbi:MAG TPA: hypothetical protein VKZ88_02730, partial [Fibrobacteria bacterium]|nr:hypothetical protein [Fibrobacteria bacterium]
MIPNLILSVLLVVVMVSCVVLVRRAAGAALARGRREAELEAATASAALKERAEDLGRRLAAAEERLENAEKAFRDMQGQKGSLEATAARVPLLETEIESLRG